jgi:hypothetical protein
MKKKSSTLDVSVFDYRGGTRFKKPLKTGTSILLRYIWLQHGGVDAVGRIFEMQSQHFVNWQRAGKVPLKNVGKIARKLKINKYALNYDGVFELLGAGPSWEEVVNLVVKDEKAAKTILKATPPEHFKGDPL